MPALGAFLRHVLTSPILSVSLAFAALSPACAELPKNVHRPASTALAANTDTPLARLIEVRRRAEARSQTSGFALLDTATAAYSARLALIKAAQKTLDLQYYAIHDDASSARLLAGVREAAERGVRVRILLDDFHGTGRNALVMDLARLPNIEMRMFNPLPGPRDGAIARLFHAIDDAGQLQQRMHNKLFIADNAMAITGGRNLGDAYFGKDHSANFVDLDVLAAGAVVQDLSRSFDSYWNNERAYPVQSLISLEALAKIREKAQSPPALPSPDGEPRPSGNASSPEQHLRVWNEPPMDLHQVPLVWAPAVVLVDQPAKIPFNDETVETSKNPGLIVTPTRDAHLTARQATDATAHAPPSNDDSVVDGLVRLIERARSDLTIVSPYFVPGPEMQAAFAAARARGVRVRILTNSLASNDAVIAHAGYVRYRKALLAMGVELYELRSQQAGLRSAMGSSGGGAGAVGSSRSMLHSKVIVIDRRLIAVGSMNFDLRSKLQNTEIALLIVSSSLAQTSMKQIEDGMYRAAWHVQDDKGQLVWRAPRGSGLADAHSEPDTSIGLRLLLKLFGPLAPEKLL